MSEPTHVHVWLCFPKGFQPLSFSIMHLAETDAENKI